MARAALRPMSDIERLKYEAAEQLGLTDRRRNRKNRRNRLPLAARKPRLKHFCAMPALIVCPQQGASFP